MTFWWIRKSCVSFLPPLLSSSTFPGRFLWLKRFPLFAHYALYLDFGDWFWTWLFFLRSVKKAKETIWNDCDWWRNDLTAHNWFLTVCFCWPFVLLTSCTAWRMQISWWRAVFCLFAWPAKVCLSRVVLPRTYFSNIKPIIYFALNEHRFPTSLELHVFVQDFAENIWNSSIRISYPE